MFLFALVSLGAFLLSLTAKLLVDALLHAPVHIIGLFVGLFPTHNPGIAFGVQLPSSIQALFILLALGLVVFAAVRSERSVIGDVGYGLIVGGALENLTDRLFDGVVTDFVQIGSFAIFNVADSCITIGVVLLLAQSLFSVRRAHLKEEPLAGA